MITTLVVATTFGRALRTHDRERLQRHASVAHQVIEERITTYITMLRSTAGFFASSHQLSHAEFRAYVQQLGLESHYAGVQGIGYSHRIRDQSVEAFEQTQRKGPFENFRVWPDSPRQIYHSITYLEPLDDRNKAAIGFDMYSNDVRRRAMVQARDSGDIAMSGRLILVQEINADVQPGFIIYLPIFANRTDDNPPATVKERQLLLKGFIYSPFRARDLFQAVFREPLLVDFAVFTGQPDENDNLLYSTIDPSRYRQVHEYFQRTTTLQPGNAGWQVRYWPASSFEYSHTWFAFLGVIVLGMLISTGLAWLSYRERSARRKTALSERYFRNIFETQFQFLTTLSPQGYITNVNSLLLQLAHVDRSTVVGKPIWEAPWWGDDLRDEQSWRSRFSAVVEQPLNSTDQMCLADGTVRTVDSAMTAVTDRAGRINFYLLQSHDITDHHQTEQRLKEETRTLEALNRLGRALSSKLDSNELMALATRRARALSGAEIACFLYRHYRDGSTDDAVAALSGIPQGVFAEKYQPLGKELFNLT